MEEIFWVALVGFGASFVDGALGMGFGATGSTLLMGMGLPPQLASGTVNLAKVATGLASGAAHWKFKNIDRKLVLRLGIPGGLGAVVGGVLVSYTDAAVIKLFMSILLGAIGVRLLFRFARQTPDLKHGRDVTTGSAGAPEANTTEVNSSSVRGVEWAGAAGGLVNGLIGAWGPLVTPFLLLRRVPPRFAIGTANTAEIFVALVSSITIVVSLGAANFDFRLLLSMLLGGVLAAPVAAWLIRYIKPRMMGLATAGLLIFLNMREVLKVVAPDAGAGVLFGLLLALALAALGSRAIRRPEKTLAA